MGGLRAGIFRRHGGLHCYSTGLCSYSCACAPMRTATRMVRAVSMSRDKFPIPVTESILSMPQLPLGFPIIKESIIISVVPTCLLHTHTHTHTHTHYPSWWWKQMPTNTHTDTHACHVTYKTPIGAHPMVFPHNLSFFISVGFQINRSLSPRSHDISAIKRTIHSLKLTHRWTHNFHRTHRHLASHLNPQLLVKLRIR